MAEELVDVVRDEVQPAGLPAGVLDGRGQQQRVGLVDLARPQRPPRLDQLAAGGQQQHARTAADRQRGDADRGGQPDLRGAERRPGRERDGARLDVLAGRAQVAARRGSVADLDDVGPSVGELDGDDDVGPGGRGAPVMIRCTVPGARGTTSERPAGMSSATGSRTGDRAAPETSAHRAA